MPFFQNQVVAITGGASGIVRATSEVLHEGAKVYITDINASSAQDLVSKFSNKVQLVPRDVSFLSSVKEFFAAIASGGNTLYGAVNAAGVNLPGVRLHETTDDF
jgi:NAD(P)-dependent dehydrogenase (short-subunit alcohol dehydrogenase family)